MLVLIGLVLAVVGIVELSTGGGGWLVLTFGVGIAVVAILILVLDPPGGRRPR